LFEPTEHLYSSLTFAQRRSHTTGLLSGLLLAEDGLKKAELR
jgi:hypothetical protein